MSRYRGFDARAFTPFRSVSRDGVIPTGAYSASLDESLTRIARCKADSGWFHALFDAVGDAHWAGTSAGGDAERVGS